jgi:importin subunit beta-1
MDPKYLEIITNCLSGEKTLREEGEKQLEQLATADFPTFLFNLATILANENAQTKVRQLVATYMKNSITKKEEFTQIWVQLGDEKKTDIKNLVLSTLASQYKEVRAGAAMVIAGICKVDLPLNEKWPSLISSLCQNVYNENINISLAAIESLGYVCEELSINKIDSSSVDLILTAFIQNIQQKQNQIEVIKAILKALYPTINLARKNFSLENERNVIMEAIFLVGNTFPNDDIILERLALLFIQIATIYYDDIQAYIAKIAEFSFYLVFTIINNFVNFR